MSEPAAPPASDVPVVDVVDVAKVYHQGPIEVRALDGVSLRIGRGDFAALAGPSGSGKTTLLNLIGGLDAPTRGTVRLDGEDIGRLPARKLAALRLRRIGFVFQAYNLIPVLSAFENVEYPLLLQGVPPDERRARVDETLARVGLGALGARRPNELSGGQQQRVAVARAVVTRPALVLADEPTANLDSKNAQDLVEMMHALNHEHHVTFLFSSHDQRVLDRAERLLRMEDGRIAGEVSQRHGQ